MPRHRTCPSVRDRLGSLGSCACSPCMGQVNLTFMSLWRKVTGGVLPPGSSCCITQMFYSSTRQEALLKIHCQANHKRMHLWATISMKLRGCGHNWQWGLDGIRGQQSLCFLQRPGVAEEETRRWSLDPSRATMCSWGLCGVRWTDMWEPPPPCTSGSGQGILSLRDSSSQTQESG